MNILVIDGQGGKLGRELIEIITREFVKADITAVGTNSAATAAMLKAGVKKAATGENAVVVAARRADVIIGPVGIVIADSMLGEITPKMALAVSQSDAVRILLPVNKCENIVAGVKVSSISELLADVVEKLKALTQERN